MYLEVRYLRHLPWPTSLDNFPLENSNNTFLQDTWHPPSIMAHQGNDKHVHTSSHTAAGEFQTDGRYQEDRSPQWNGSNESCPSIAQRRVARDFLNETPDGLLDNENGGDDIVLIDVSETILGPPSVATGSDHTVVDRVVSTYQPPAVPGSALTTDNMVIHDLVQPLGFMSTYEWVHGRRCPGDMDVKDISSKESIRARCRSRLSHSTIALEDEYGMVNHPSEAFVACAGDWADVAALPASFDKTLFL
ncbi:uncharacterized protein CTRU02_205704 [Colletotrichum truncatum]|uniref:Uncharacterized protein n=1 Tax=Colletotrichum truncatum TaxID=5467 RepID=A0ACC3Z4S9_COLTU|nr:uncharacterized protein CTRU02_09455 [Colletotrichum truncatum]KAF6788647.1 hypothetical protein CTRU02_09455 [Colletotrichum truncatum]